MTTGLQEDMNTGGYKDRIQEHSHIYRKIVKQEYKNTATKESTTAGIHEYKNRVLRDYRNTGRH